MMKKIAYDKYLLPTDYESALPEYFFMYNGEVINDEEILVRKLAHLIQKRNKLNFNHVLEMGIGTGRMTKHLLRCTEEFSGIDISSNMVNKVKERYKLTNLYNVDIQNYIYNADLLGFELICSFWAFNYAILDHFEELDMDQKKVVPKANLSTADKESKKMIRTMFEKTSKNTDLLFFYFDPNSEEQNIVTDFWTRVCPFPYGRRDHTLNLFIESINELQIEGLIQYNIEKVDGYVYFSNQKKMEEGFVNLHFKGFFNEEEDYENLIKELKGKTEHFKENDGTYRVPAGLYIIQVEKQG